MAREWDHRFSKPSEYETVIQCCSVIFCRQSHVDKRDKIGRNSPSPTAQSVHTHTVHVLVGGCVAYAIRSCHGQVVHMQ